MEFIFKKILAINFSLSIILTMKIQTMVNKLLKKHTYRELAGILKTTERSIYNYSQGRSEPVYSKGKILERMVNNRDQEDL